MPTTVKKTKSCNETVAKIYVIAVVLVAATLIQNQRMKSGNHIAFFEHKWDKTQYHKRRATFTFYQVLNSTGILNIYVCYFTEENEESIHNNKQLQNKLLNCSDDEGMITMNILSSSCPPMQYDKQACMSCRTLLLLSTEQEKDGCRRFLCNAGTYLPNYKAELPRTQ